MDTRTLRLRVTPRETLDLTPGAMTPGPTANVTRDSAHQSADLVADLAAADVTLGVTADVTRGSARQAAADIAPSTAPQVTSRPKAAADAGELG
jgi:hypothetical protein